MVLQNRRTVYPHCWIGHFYPPLRRFHHKRGTEEGVGEEKEEVTECEEEEQVQEEERRKKEDIWQHSNSAGM